MKRSRQDREDQTSSPAPNPSGRPEKRVRFALENGAIENAPSDSEDDVDMQREIPPPPPRRKQRPTRAAKTAAAANISSIAKDEVEEQDCNMIKGAADDDGDRDGLYVLDKESDQEEENSHDVADVLNEEMPLVKQESIAEVPSAEKALEEEEIQIKKESIDGITWVLRWVMRYEYHTYQTADLDDFAMKTWQILRKQALPVKRKIDPVLVIEQTSVGVVLTVTKIDDELGQQLAKVIQAENMNLTDIMYSGMRKAEKITQRDIEAGVTWHWATAQEINVNKDLHMISIVGEVCDCE